MKKVNDEDLDKMFRKGFDTPGNEPVYSEADWEAMESVLDNGNKRPLILVMLPWLSVAAAVAIFFLAWLLFRPGTENFKNKNGWQTQIAKGRQKNTGNGGGGPRQQTADSAGNFNVTAPTASYASKPVHHGKAITATRSYPYSPGTTAAKLPDNNKSDIALKAVPERNESAIPGTRTTVPPLGNSVAANGSSANADTGKLVGTAADANKLSNAQMIASATKKDLATADARKQTGTADARKETGTADANSPKNQNAIAKVKTASVVHAVYALSVIGSSDVNGVNGMQGGRVGGNLGAMFSASLNKWTFSAGLMYSIKPYQESFANYHTSYVFGTNPSSIGVNCKMLDIPLNINYQIFRNNGNRITLGTGLSSYIILREDYSFNYASAYAQGPGGYSIINRNKTILGVLNLDATYEHQINGKLGVLFQPYLKLPFTDVGESKAKLQSAGVAIGFSWNLNSLKRPD